MIRGKLMCRAVWLQQLIPSALFLLSHGVCYAADGVEPGLPSTRLILLQTLLGLGVILALIFALAWLLRRLNILGSSQNSSIQMVSSLALGAREKIALIEIEGQRVLVGVCPGNIRTLHVLESDTTGVEKREEASRHSVDPVKDADEVKQSSYLSASSASEFSKKLSAFLSSGSRP